MPMKKVEVIEYECIKCGYRWINRVNGVDGPIPKRCAKCKRTNWNQGSPTPKEIGLRRRIDSLKTIYEYQSLALFRDKVNWTKGLTEKFLNLDPRPTMAELERVLYAPELVLRLDSQNQFSHRRYVPVSDKPGLLKYDPREYEKLFKQDAQTQQQLMQMIIDSRPNSRL